MQGRGFEDPDGVPVRGRPHPRRRAGTGRGGASAGPEALEGEGRVGQDPVRALRPRDLARLADAGHAVQAVRSVARDLESAVRGARQASSRSRPRRRPPRPRWRPAAVRVDGVDVLLTPRRRRRPRLRARTERRAGGRRRGGPPVRGPVGHADPTTSTSPIWPPLDAGFRRGHARLRAPTASSRSVALALGAVP